MIIWAGTKGYLDDIPVELCRRFEAELYRYCENVHRAVLDEIKTKKALDADLTAKVMRIVEEFKARFMAENAPAKAHA